jgi:signal transduction histidine kinase
MRERLIAALVGMTVAVIALYGVPRAYLLADLVQRQEERKIERSVDLLAHLVAERTQDRAPVTEEYLTQLLNEAESIEYVAPDGAVVSAGTPAGGRESDIVMERSLPGGGTVTLSRSGSLIDQRVSEALLPLVLIGLALTALSAVTGFWLARRMARPFQELAAVASRLGSGRFDVAVPHYSVPEAEGIGSALRESAEQLETLVRREREFAVNASHQLRTPITALRFELEDLSQWPETTPAVAAELELALAELDRLSEAISELLGLARGLRQDASVELDLAGLAAETVGRWQAHAESRDRKISHQTTGATAARVTPGPVKQILDVLIENACTHGRGDITVTTSDAGAYLCIRVSDEGRLDLDHEVFRRGVSGAGGTGVGLAVATELAESMGGRLDLDEGQVTTFVLRLPRVAHPAQAN